MSMMFGRYVNPSTGVSRAQAVRVDADGNLMTRGVIVTNREDLTAAGLTPEVITLANAYVSGSLQVWTNGVFQSVTDYTETDPTTGVFTFNAGSEPVVGDKLIIIYQISS